MILVTVPLNRLVHARANVRKTEREAGLDELAASITAHGLRQNLNVRPIPGGRYEVVAGGRRLLALKRLARTGALPSDAPVPQPTMPCFGGPDMRTLFVTSLSDGQSEAVRSQYPLTEGVF